MLSKSTEILSISTERAILRRLKCSLFLGPRAKLIKRGLENAKSSHAAMQEKTTDVQGVLIEEEEAGASVLASCVSEELASVEEAMKVVFTTESAGSEEDLAFLKVSESRPLRFQRTLLKAAVFKFKW